MQMIEEVRSCAKIVSCKEDTKMIELAKSKNPPTKYQCGDSVIIRRFSSSSKRVSAINSDGLWPEKSLKKAARVAITK